MRNHDDHITSTLERDSEDPSPVLCTALIRRALAKGGMQGGGEGDEMEDRAAKTQAWLAGIRSSGSTTWAVSILSAGNLVTKGCNVEGT